MVQTLDRNGRRIFNFPAVHPCEGISPGILLESLISLSHSICEFKSKLFATQRKNARETIRQTEILLIFFEEMREHVPSISDSMMLSFSELHLTFQKIQFILEDCSREGARLWILMKAHFVATQFLVLIRSLATALDVLSLGSIDLPCEIKELIELETKQAQRAKMEIDPEDENAMKRVILILNQFENQFEPDPSFIKRVLDYLGIRSWGECQKEVKFLDDQVSLGFSDGEERELPLLSSLLGFVSYCRGALFDDCDYGSTDQSDGVYNAELIPYLNPEDFRCPISLELMTDPVTVATGQTYDRTSIQKWLKSGNLLCPKTGEKLTSTELVPNSALKRLVQQFCADNGISLAKSRKKNRDISRTIAAGSPAAAEAIKFLSEYLASKLDFGRHEQKKKAAYEIRLLAKSNIFNRSCLIEAGAISALLKLLATNDPPAQENAISALLKLSKHSRGKKDIIQNGGLKLILNVLKDGLKLEGRQIAAAIIFYLSSVREYRKLIGETPQAIPSLVELIKNGTTCGKRNALVAIFGLLLSKKNHQKALSAETVPVIIDLLSSSDKPELITDALAVLATLAESMDGSFAVLQSSALSLIVSLLQSTTSRAGKEYCISILQSLCLNCGVAAMAALAREPSLMPALYSLLTEGTYHATKKARSMIKILQKFSETGPSHFVKEVPQEQFIDVR